MIETFNIKEKYNSKKNYNGPGSKDPNWIRKSLNIKPIIYNRVVATIFSLANPSLKLR